MIHIKGNWKSELIQCWLVPSTSHILIHSMMIWWKLCVHFISAMPRAEIEKLFNLFRYSQLGWMEGKRQEWRKKRKEASKRNSREEIIDTISSPLSVVGCPHSHHASACGAWLGLWAIGNVALFYSHIIAVSRSIGSGTTWKFHSPSPWWIAKPLRIVHWIPRSVNVFDISREITIGALIM